MKPSALGWFSIVRLGLVQTSLGAIVVLMTSTINRVMIVELALPAFVPGLLVASHYAVQILRPAWGFGSDLGGRRSPWIIGGMAMLAIGGVGAAAATALASSHLAAGLALAAFSFLLIGVGVGAAGTSVLTMLATHVAPSRRAAAATTVWVMMILGFAITAPLAGHFLDPFSNMRLIVVTTTVAAVAFIVATLAVAGVESGIARSPAPVQGKAGHKQPALGDAVRQIWNEPAARRFTIFIFVSMLAYSAQELIIEPYAGVVFAMTPGTTTKLAGVQHGGVLAGMIIVALCASVLGGPVLGSLRLWTVGGCIASALSLFAIAASAHAGPEFPLRAAVCCLGLSNGAFAVSAIGSMMGLAGKGAAAREGTRMGLWGAAQAIAFGLGGLVGTISVDIARHWATDPRFAFSSVFVGEAVLFLIAATLALNISPRDAIGARHSAISKSDDPLIAGT